MKRCWTAAFSLAGVMINPHENLVRLKRRPVNEFKTNSCDGDYTSPR